MTAYTDERDAAGRRVFYILEVTLDQCGNDYTSSPCTAADAGDGARCFYSWATCQDRPNYVKSSQTWRFISGHIEPQDVPAIWATWVDLYPLLGKVTQGEQEVSIFGGFTRQEKRSFSLGDVTGNDGHDIVPELSPGKTGLVNTTRAGSLWRRMIAIHPNYVDRTVTLYQGFATPTFATTDLKSLWKGRLSGLKFAKDGGVTLEAKDLFGDFEKKIPRKIGKTNTVQESISRTATLVKVADAAHYSDPADASAGYTVAQVRTVSGLLELVKITSRDTAADTLTVTRGQFGTSAESWRGDDEAGLYRGTSVKEVIHYSSDDGLNGLDPIDVLQDLLDRAGVASADIDSASMTQAQKWIGPWKVRRTVTKPVQAKKLIHELLELYQSALYIDDDRTIKLWVSRPADVGESYPTLAEDQILDLGAQYDQGEDRRLTHASIAYGYRGDGDGTGDGVVIYFNDESFTQNFYGVGEFNRYERALKGGRWVQVWDEYQAAVACARWAKRSERGRERLTFHVDLRDESDLQVGTLVNATSRYIQNEFGGQRTVRCVVISRKRVSPGRYRVTIESIGTGLEDGSQDDRRYAFMGPASMVDYDSDSAANQAAYGYLADASETLGAAGDRGKEMP